MAAGRVTLRDVAQQAGVHVSAVSAVLGHSSSATARVSAETRARVMDAARDLGYTPNRLARGLRTGRFETVGLVHSFYFPDLLISNQYVAGILRGVLRAAHARHYNVSLPALPWHEDRPAGLADLHGQGIDGFIIVAPSADSDLVSALRDRGTPVVVVSADASVYGVPTVDIDNRAGVLQALEHLWQLGHRHVAFITRPYEQHDTRARRAAFLEAHEARGWSVPPGYVQVLSEHREGHAVDFVHDLVGMTPTPTAALAVDDELALVVATSAVAAGLDIPGDFSLIGFDDTPQAAGGPIPLTTVAQPLVAMGMSATDQLIALLDGEHAEPVTCLFPPQLVVRASTGTPAPWRDGV